MKIQVGEVEYLLKTGDSLYFNSIQKHDIIPVSNKVIYLDILLRKSWLGNINFACATRFMRIINSICSINICAEIKF